MNVVSDKVETLVQLEYEADCKDHGPLASLHEGYAVLLEEIEEADEACRDLKIWASTLWNFTRGNYQERAIEAAQIIELHAIAAACEAIQVAAVCKRIADLETHINR